MNQISKRCFIGTGITLIMAMFCWLIGNYIDPLFIAGFFYCVFACVALFITAIITLLIKRKTITQAFFWTIFASSFYAISAACLIYSIYDLNKKDMFFSGLAGTLILIFLLPVTLSAAIIFSIIAIIKKWKKR